jgi:hypothetical protein
LFLVATLSGRTAAYIAVTGAQYLAARILNGKAAAWLMINAATHSTMPVSRSAVATGIDTREHLDHWCILVSQNGV